MYCINCGKENPDDVKFCCFCGTAAQAPRFVEDIAKNLAENGQLDLDENDAPESNEKAVETTEQNPINAQIPVQPVVPTAPVNASVPISPISSVSPVRNPVTSSPNGYTANPYAYPQPLPISTQGVSAAKAPQDVRNMNIPVKNFAPEEKQPVGRTFTLKHIIMCLASTAVCAIAAGIFAGLYFSVV